MRQTTAVPAAKGRRTIGSGTDLSAAVTVFVTTVGAPTFSDCVARLEAQDVTVSFGLIDHVAPLTAALQEMADRCATPYYVQVDEDMLLDSDAIRRLYDLIRREWHDVAIVVGMLDDDHLGRPIEGIKINRLEMVRDFDWRIHGSVLRRNAALAAAHYRVARRPLSDSGQKMTFGTHVIGRDPRTVFDRYRDLEHLRRAAPDELDWFAGHADEFVRRFRATGDAVDFFALMGILTAGAEETAGQPESTRAKDFRRRDADAAFDAATELWRALEGQRADEDG